MAASRKKGDYSVLSEINTEEEWDSLCQRKVSDILLFHRGYRVIVSVTVDFFSIKQKCVLYLILWYSNLIFLDQESKLGLPEVRKER